jgi:hypothetical protein
LQPVTLLWIENAWRSSCQFRDSYFYRSRQARANNSLPAVSIAHSAVVFNMPRLRRKAGLNTLSLSLSS